ncbi:MAG: ankyrin repeat domain-containing protein [Planctomycetota bacterium]
MGSDNERWIKPLPAKPSLERQRKRAKALVRAWWRGGAGESEAVERLRALHPKPPEPGAAKLSDAQLVVARGYGFAKWTDLIRKIESLTRSPFERFVSAVKAGDVPEMERLFEAHPECGQRINEPVGGFGGTLLFAVRGNLLVFDWLVEHGADVNRKSDWGPGGFGLAEDQPSEVALAMLERGVVEDIWVAVGLDRLDRVRAILDGDASLVTARGGDGKHPLHYATSVEMVDLLVERGADVNARDIDHGSTPVQYRVKDEAVVRRLLEHGAEPDVFLAAALGDIELLEGCLAVDEICLTHRLGVFPWVNEHGGHIYNWTLGHGRTPIEVAMEGGHRTVEERLLEASPPKQRFLAAAWRGDVQGGQAVLGEHPGLLDEMSADDHAALNRACWWYRPEAVTTMLALGFDRHITDNEKMTPLDRAAFHGHAACLAELLEGDPEPPLEWVHQYDGTPIQTCVHGALHGWATGFEQDHARCAELLLGAGAKIEAGWLPTGHDAIDVVFRRALAKDD